MQYLIDPASIVATGIINEPSAYMSPEDKAKLGEGEPVPRATVSREDRRLALDIECSRIVEEYGQRRTVTYDVRVPDTPEARAVVAGPIHLLNPRVTVYISKKGILKESFVADGVASGKRSGE